MKAKTVSTLNKLVHTGGGDLLKKRDVVKAFEDAGAIVEEGDNGLNIQYEHMNFSIAVVDDTKVRPLKDFSLGRAVDLILNGSTQGKTSRKRSASAKTRLSRAPG